MGGHIAAPPNGLDQCSGLWDWDVEMMLQEMFQPPRAVFVSVVQHGGAEDLVSFANRPLKAFFKCFSFSINSSRTRIVLAAASEQSFF